MTHYIFGFLESSQYTTISLMFVVTCCILGKTWKEKNDDEIYLIIIPIKKIQFIKAHYSSLEYSKTFHMVHLASSTISIVKRTQNIITTTTTTFLQPHSN